MTTANSAINTTLHLAASLVLCHTLHTLLQYTAAEEGCAVELGQAYTH
jgi:hypothetical protein